MFNIQGYFMSHLNKWDNRYLNLAKEISTWSKDPSTQVGAIAVSNKKFVLSQGFNGFPQGIDDSKKRYNDRDTKYKFVIHAEMNVIYSALCSGVSLDGSTLYVYGLPPCSDCAKGIIQVGIKKVVAEISKELGDRCDSIKLAQEMFDEANVDVIIKNF